jgi:hypothetical protein
MRISPALPATLLLFCSAAFSQSLPTPIAPAATAQDVLLESLSAFSLLPIGSVHLTGSAHATAGVADETGTFDFTLKSTGESTLKLAAGTLSRTETTATFGENPACTWAGADSVEHKTAYHNCWNSLDWIVPALSLQARLAGLNARFVSSASGVPAATAPVELSRTIQSAQGTNQELFRKLSAASVALDQQTFLPTALAFNVHPDADAGTDIPVTVHYSDYRRVSGAMLPFHIEKFLNNTKVLDLTVETAEVQQ